MAKFIGQTGLIYLWSKIKAWVAQYVIITEADNVKTLTVGNTSATLVTKTSQLTNDSNYITISDVPEGAVASTSTPLMDVVQQKQRLPMIARVWLLVVQTLLQVIFQAFL